MRKLLGKPIELFRDEPVGEAADSVDQMSQVEIYRRSLEAGLPRDPEVEKKLGIG